jgi:hypothetical protein
MESLRKYSRNIGVIRKCRVLFVILVGVSFAFGGAGQTSSANPCDAVHSAYQKMFSASNNSRATNSGAVNVTQAYGKITSEAGHKESCKYLRDESLAGEPAAVYSEIFTATSGTATGTIWISKKAGYTLRQDVDVDMGAKGKGHQSMIFDYPKK